MDAVEWATGDGGSSVGGGKPPVMKAEAALRYSGVVCCVVL